VTGGTSQASDEARRILKMFGVAVTTYEDAVERIARAEEINKAEAELDTRLFAS
jgi:hypothetical protein